MVTFPLGKAFNKSSLVSSSGLLDCLPYVDEAARKHIIELLNHVTPDLWFENSGLVEPLQNVAKNSPAGALLAAHISFYLGSSNECVKCAVSAAQLLRSVAPGVFRSFTVASVLGSFVKDSPEHVRSLASSIFSEMEHASSEYAAGLGIFLSMVCNKKDWFVGLISQHKQGAGSALSDTARLFEAHGPELAVGRISEAGGSHSSSASSGFGSSLGKFHMGEFFAAFEKEMAARISTDSPSDPLALASSLGYAAESLDRSVSEFATSTLAQCISSLLFNSSDSLDVAATAFQIATNLYGQNSHVASLVASSLFKLHRELAESEASEQRAALMGELGCLYGSVSRSIAAHAFMTPSENHKDDALYALMKAVTETPSAVPMSPNQSLTPLPSVLQSSIMISHALATCGTADDSFVKANVAWVKRAGTGWSQFTANAASGPTYRNLECAEILSRFRSSIPFPKHDWTKTSADGFKDGGALFGLGLACFGHSQLERQSVLSQVDVSSFLSSPDGCPEPLIYGACLFTGLMHLGDESYTPHIFRDDVSSTMSEDSRLSKMLSLRDSAIYHLQAISASDRPISSEGSLLALGMMCAGLGKRIGQQGYSSSKIRDLCSSLFEIAVSSKHERVSRSAGRALCMIFANAFSSNMATQAAGPNGIESEPMALASSYASTLLSSESDSVRSSGVLLLGSIYHGTRSVSILERVLQVAVRDAGDETKRSAVIALHSIYGADKQGLIAALDTLENNYAPALRYACYLVKSLCVTATLEAGVPLASKPAETTTGKSSGFSKERVEFVKQAKWLYEASIPAADDVLRTHLFSLFKERHGDLLSRIGAGIGLGWQVATRHNVVDCESLVGMCGALLYSNTFNFFPHGLFSTLCLKPSVACVLEVQHRESVSNAETLLSFNSSPQPVRQSISSRRMKQFAKNTDDAWKDSSVAIAASLQLGSQASEDLVLPILARELVNATGRNHLVLVMGQRKSEGPLIKLPAELASCFSPSQVPAVITPGSAPEEAEPVVPQAFRYPM